MDITPTLQQSGCARFGVDPASLKSLGGSDGAVYLCRKGERAHVIKFVPLPPQGRNRFEERLAFQTYLAEHGVRAACPLPSLQDRLYELVEENGQSYAVVLTLLASGAHIDRRRPEWGPRLFEAWGQTLGRMHALTQAYPHWRREEPDEIAFSSHHPAADQHLIDWRMEYTSFMHWADDPQILKGWEKLAGPLSALPIERSGYGLIHNDLHMYNFVYDSTGITVLDFDVCCYHWFITDIAIAFYQAALMDTGDRPDERAAFARTFLPAFRYGYEGENRLDSFWWQQMNLFIRYRQGLLYTALSHDWPAEKRAAWQEKHLKRIKTAFTSSKPFLNEYA